MMLVLSTQSQVTGGYVMGYGTSTLLSTTSREELLLLELVESRQREWLVQIVLLHKRSGLLPTSFSPSHALSYARSGDAKG